MVKLEQQVSIVRATLVTITTSKQGGEDIYNFSILVDVSPDLGLENVKNHCDAQP
jgi:hypothetical protein